MVAAPSLMSMFHIRRGPVLLAACLAKGARRRLLPPGGARRLVHDPPEDNGLAEVLAMLRGERAWSLKELRAQPATPVSQGDLEELADLAHIHLPDEGQEALRGDLERVLGFLGTVDDAVPLAAGHHDIGLAPSKMLDGGVLREDVVSEGDCADELLSTMGNRAQGAYILIDG